MTVMYNGMLLLKFHCIHMTLTNRIRISFILFLSSEVNKRELLSEVLG